MTLTFALANNVLTVTDTGKSNAWLFSGATSIRMDYQNATAATYFISNAGNNLTFKLSEISTIGGAGPNANPTLALAQLKAVLPLYV